MGRLFSVVLALAFLLSASGVAMAEDSTLSNMFSTDTNVEDRWNLSVLVSAIFTDKDKDTDYDNGVGVHGMLSYDIFKWLGIGVETGYLQRDVKVGGMGIGQMHAMPILGDIIIKFPIEYENLKFVPYCVNGFGLLISSIEEDRKNVPSGVYVGTNTPFLYKLGGGLDFYMNEVLGITGEISYQWTEIDYDVEINGTDVGSAKRSANALYIGGGVKLKF